MPRRRPGRVRAELPDRQRAQQGTRSAGTRTAIDRLSSSAVSEIARIERTRNYLLPGDTASALSRWKAYGRRTRRQVRHDDEFGDTDWYCCGDPLEGRTLLDRVMASMSRQGARELRSVVSALDARFEDG
ncbi:hypothetical protein HY68_00305 [Streptomyces sp. AcH 505]|uniref:hypothetical protein n=1 Tax=Streptomyces sp. AcH 505 TaxID=352211 RepID=UPI000591B325|nr:hypothetical protein HY68_00305 [Streptomyces sp. AcH 505]